MNSCFTVPAMVYCIIWGDVKTIPSAEDEISLLPSFLIFLSDRLLELLLFWDDPCSKWFLCRKESKELFTAAAGKSCVWTLQIWINSISMLLSNPHFLHTRIIFKSFSDTVIEQVTVLECCSFYDKCHCAIDTNIWRNTLNCFGSQLSLCKVIFVLHMGWEMFLYYSPWLL